MACSKALRRDQRQQHPVVQPGGYLLGVKQHLAVDFEGGDGRDVGDHREGDQAARQASQLALLLGVLVLRTAREIAEIENQCREVGDLGSADRHQRATRPL